MLCVGVGMCAWGRLKRHWTNRTLVEDFTVRTLNVRLQCSHIRVHNIAMYTSVREINTQSLERDPYTHVQLNCVKWTHCNGLLRFLIAFWKCASFFPIFICKKEDHEEEEEENWNGLEFEHLKDSWKGCPDWGENNSTEAVPRPGTQRDPVTSGFAEDSYPLDLDLRALRFLAVPSTQMSSPVEDVHYLTLHAIKRGTHRGTRKCRLPSRGHCFLVHTGVVNIAGGLGAHRVEKVTHLVCLLENKSKFKKGHKSYKLLNNQHL